MIILLVESKMNWKEAFNEEWRVLSQLDRDMLDMFGQSPARSGK